MAQKFQITHINTSGAVSVLHPETNADQVVDGSINKISKKTEVSDWNAKSQEVAEARLGKTTLKEKIESARFEEEKFTREGNLEKAVTVKAAKFTASAQEKIEKAGGKAELV